MTPYQKAQQILADLEARAADIGLDLPTLRYAQIGTPVVSCASLIVAVTNLAPEAGGAGVEDIVVCDAAQMGTFTILFSHDCSWVANDDGSDDPARVVEASAHMDASGSFLWDYANEYVPYISKTWSLSWSLVGGLGISTLTLTVGID